MFEQIRTCEEAARAAGEVLMQWRGQVKVREKAPADLVTEADLSSQNVIQQTLARAYPDYAFVGEETAPEQDAGGDPLRSAAELRWIVDPLDGTTNYVHGLPGWCVSIALARGSRIVGGCVFDPLQDLCFTAMEDAGAFCNGERIATSDTSDLREALVAVSMPATINRDSPEVAVLLAMLPRVRAFRRLGSAALNLCHLAAGNLDGYWASRVNAWDVAAGVLFVREAGGVVSGLQGEPFQLSRPHLTAASTPRLHEELVAVVKPAWTEGERS